MLMNNEQRRQVAREFKALHKSEFFPEFNDLNIYYNLRGGLYGTLDLFDANDPESDHIIEISSSDSASGNPRHFYFEPDIDDHYPDPLKDFNMGGTSPLC